MRLRQIALAAHDRDRVVADLAAVLGIEVAFDDPGVAVFGLRNAVLPVGDDFLEVVSPIQADTAAGRYLARRGGDCGYMVMVQVDNTAATRERAAAAGVRVVWSIDLDDISGTHFHPRDLGGALLSVDTPRPADAWRWAGPDWPAHVRRGVVDGLVAVDIACADAAATAERWATVLGRPAARRGDTYDIALDAGRLRFLPAETAGQDGVVAIELRTHDRAAARAAATARNLEHGDDWVCIGGTALRFV
jgi:hypothetical protein